jgi:histidinol dehydrogenase
MQRPLKLNSPEADEALAAIVARRDERAEDARGVAGAMIDGVRRDGDAFVATQIARFDGVTLAPETILTTPGDAEPIDPALEQALELAIRRVEDFHRPQMPAGYTWGDVEHRVRPLRRVGVYVPGGRAVYISTLIMCAVPARVAGVSEIVVATTPTAASRPELQWVCRRLGIREIYRAGGAAGIAALALGTQSLERVDKIVGPGNAYVTAAKARLVGEVGIDMTAGPTELVVIADDTADPTLVQADLDAQQEHGADSAVILISVGKPLDVRATLNLVADSIEDAVAASDRIAPEHLSIQTRDARRVAALASNAGAIYCGPFSPPAAGDYAIGSNHVLPTAGSARFFSPLGTYDFVKRTNVIALDEASLAAVASAAACIADYEGLPRHARSIDARFAEVRS